MEFKSAQNHSTTKLSILKLGEYEMWVIRIKQYFQVQDYALWEVIENDNSWVSIPQTTQENGFSVTKMPVPTTAEEKINKKNDVKARSLVLMALPNEHQLTFIWMNKADIETISIDDLYNNFKIIEQDVKKSVGTSTGAQNMAFMTASSISNTNDVNTANPTYEASTVSPNVNTVSPQDLKKIHKDDLEAIDLRWQLSLPCMRAKRYFKKTRKKIFINANDTAGYDNSKVECFNCYKMGYFARECKAQRNQDGQFRNQNNTRKQGNNKDTSSKAMLAIDATYKRGLATVEEQLVTYKKNEVLFSKEVAVLKREVACKNYEINMLKTTKDETNKILKNFIKEIENLVDKKVKIIRCDNGTEFKNKVMDDFCKEKGIKREYIVARTPQQNGVADRRNRKLIEATRTTLSDSKLPTTFWAEAVSIACYVHNRVLIVKPHNKTSYKLFRGFKPALSFMRAFGCHVTILNTFDNLGKFDGTSDEGFFVRYSLSSKAFRVYNTRTKKVEENLHIEFLENKPMIEGNGPKWLFDINSLTTSINYVPVAAAIISDESASTQRDLNACTSSGKEATSQDYIVMPIWKDASYFDTPSMDVEDGTHNEDDDKDKSEDDSSPKKVNVAGQHVITASLEVNIGRFELNIVDPSLNTASSSDPHSPTDMFKLGASDTLEATPVEFFNDIDAPEVNLGNIPSSYGVPTTSHTRIHKDHPIENIEHTSIAKALSDSSWVKAMHEELLQFKLQQCKKQIVVATSTTEAEYVAAASCCRQVLWIQNQLLDYGKAFRVYNTRTKKVEENLRIRFLKNKPIIEGNGPKWLFDIDSLTQSINYVPVAAGTISDESTGAEEDLNAGTSSEKEATSQDYIVMPIWKDASYFDSPSKVVEDGLHNEDDDNDKFNDDSSPKEVNAVGQHVNTASLEVNTSCFELNTVDPSLNTDRSSNLRSPTDMFKFGASDTLKATHVEFFSDRDALEVDLGNIPNSYGVPTTSHTRIHKDHPIKNVIGEVKSSVLVLSEVICSDKKNDKTYF
nr:hypothetical protein [Tanacetum cinerariifolium]GEY18507.1 hypothetical protein [Tanacetum cinerariifolium]